MILWNKLFLVFISLLITLNNRVSIAYITIFCYTNSVMESWQSGNAPDSKSGEPMLNGRAGSNPVLSFHRRIYEKLKPQSLDLIGFGVLVIIRNEKV